MNHVRELADLQEATGEGKAYPFDRGCTFETILKEGGYKWRSARVVLTSRDPESPDLSMEGIIYKSYQNSAKTKHFPRSIEYGPFAVKTHKGGVKRVAERPFRICEFRSGRSQKGG